MGDPCLCPLFDGGAGIGRHWQSGCTLSRGVGYRRLGALGISIGIPAGYLSGRLRSGDPTLSEALGIVFLTAGSALWLDVSFLLTGIACGATVSIPDVTTKPFHEIEHIEWPFMIFFFVLAGAPRWNPQISVAAWRTGSRLCSCFEHWDGWQADGSAAACIRIRLS
jgi:hypothetical protein